MVEGSKTWDEPCQILAVEKTSSSDHCDALDECYSIRTVHSAIVPGCQEGYVSKGISCIQGVRADSGELLQNVAK